MLAFVLGLALGISLAAPPGPMNALIAREASRHGAASGIRIGMGAPVADVLWLVVLLFGLGRILSGDAFLQGAAVFGTAVMLHFAYDTWTADTRHVAARPATFLAGFIAALTNPYQAAWWLSGGFIFLQSQGLVGIAGLIMGIFGWVVVFSWLVSHGAGKWRWFTPTIRWLSTAMLLGFSVVLAAVALGIVVLD